MPGMEITDDRDVPSCNGRQLAVLLGSTVAILVAFNVGIGHLLRGEPNDGGSGRVYQKWRLLDLQTEPVDTLILGDSSGDTGARPDVLQARFGGKAINLCTMAPMLVLNDAWMLEEYLRKVGKPKQVLIVHVYDVWRRKTAEMLPMLHNIPRAYGYWDRFGVTITPPLTDRFHFAVYQLLPPFAKRDALWKFARSGFQQLPDLGDVGFVVRHHGFHLEQSPRPEWVRNISAAHKRSISAAGPLISDVNAAALDRLLALSNEHDLPMFFAASPLYRELYADAEFRAGYQAIATEVRRRIEASDAPAVYLFEEPPLYAADQMETVDHVVGEDATRDYSQRVAEALTLRRSEIAQKATSPTVRR